jgi:hypothetical protein
MRRPDVLEHANRNDAVECASDVAVVQKPELNVIFGAFANCATLCDFELLARQGNAKHFDASGAVEMQRQASPTAANVQDTLSRAKIKFGCDVPELRCLCLL